MAEPRQWILMVNWERFQHRDVLRSGRPAWIKLHTRLLTDDDFLDLTPHRQLLLIKLWMLFSVNRGQVVSTTARLSQQLSQRVVRSDLESLNDAGFIEFSASKPASIVASEPASLEVEVEDIERTNERTSLEDRQSQPAGPLDRVDENSEEQDGQLPDGMESWMVDHDLPVPEQPDAVRELIERTAKQIGSP